jgi:hypothetical protein
MPSEHPARPCRRMGRALLRPVLAVHARVQARLDVQDADARARGWTVDVRPLGGRTCRDPRFDRLAARAGEKKPITAGRGVR